jgi:hypothetical protein
MRRIHELKHKIAKTFVTELGVAHLIQLADADPSFSRIVRTEDHLTECQSRYSHAYSYAAYLAQQFVKLSI